MIVYYHCTRDSAMLLLTCHPYILSMIFILLSRYAHAQPKTQIDHALRNDDCLRPFVVVLQNIQYANAQLSMKIYVLAKFHTYS